MKRPSFQFYPADWRKDAALQSCSIAAQGLWINVMCIAHECEPYGHLIINGKPMNAAQIGRLVGLSAKECQALIDELSEAGVLSFDDDGAIFSRRMIKDEELRNIRANGGKAGSSHGSKGAEHGGKGGRPKKTRGDKKPPLPETEKPPLDNEEDPPLKPPPSSSSSSSSSREDKSSLSGECDDSPYGDPKPAALLAKSLRTLGVQVTPGNPSFAQWAKSGLTADEATAAVEIARCTKPEPEPIPWAYLAKVLESQRKQGSSSVPDSDDRYGGMV